MIIIRSNYACFRNESDLESVLAELGADGEQVGDGVEDVVVVVQLVQSGNFVVKKGQPDRVSTGN